MDETWVPGENHRPAASHWQTSPDWDYTGFTLSTNYKGINKILFCKGNFDKRLSNHTFQPHVLLHVCIFFSWSHLGYWLIDVSQVDEIYMCYSVQIVLTYARSPWIIKSQHINYV